MVRHLGYSWFLMLLAINVQIQDQSHHEELNQIYEDLNTCNRNKKCIYMIYTHTDIAGWKEAVSLFAKCIERARKSFCCQVRCLGYFEWSKLSNIGKAFAWAALLIPAQLVSSYNELPFIIFSFSYTVKSRRKDQIINITYINHDYNSNNYIIYMIRILNAFCELSVHLQSTKHIIR